MVGVCFDREFAPGHGPVTAGTHPQTTTKWPKQGLMSTGRNPESETPFQVKNMLRRSIDFCRRVAAIMGS